MSKCLYCNKLLKGLTPEQIKFKIFFCNEECYNLLYPKKPYIKREKPVRRKYKKRKKKVLVKYIPKPKKYRAEFTTVLHKCYCLICGERLYKEKATGRYYCRRSDCKVKPTRKTSFKELHPELYDPQLMKQLKAWLLSKYKYECMKCGSARRILVDHIKPRYYGGTNDKDNIQLLCWKCNTHKRLKTVDYRPFL